MKSTLITSLIILSISLLISFDRKKDLNPFNLQDPEKIIVDNFKNHDIILLGEPHHVKQHLHFLIKLIPRLYEAGVTNLCYEFLPYDRQGEIDDLLTSATFDYRKAQDLILYHYFEWNEKEYVEVLYQVWSLNNKLGNSKKKFRIIGLGDSENWDNDRFQKWTEEKWAEYVKKEVLDKDEKALAYCGMHHAITKFQQPYYDAEKNAYGLANRDRFGQYLYSVLGNRCITAYLHYYWPNDQNILEYQPCGGYIDSLSNSIGAPFAFETYNSKLGNLTDTISIYGRGINQFSLKKFTDIYIVLNPVCETELNTPFFDVANDSNINSLNMQLKFFYNMEPLTPSQLNDSLIESHKAILLEFKNLKKNNCK